MWLWVFLISVMLCVWGSCFWGLQKFSTHWWPKIKVYRHTNHDSGFNLSAVLGRGVWRFVPWQWRTRLQGWVFALEASQSEALAQRLLGKSLLCSGLLLGVLSYVYQSLWLWLWWPVVGLASAAVLILKRYRLLQQHLHTQRCQVAFFLDLLGLAVESGLGVSAALQQTTAVLPDGFLKDNLYRTLSSLQAGQSREQSLRDMAERSRLPELHRLVSAIEHSVQTGSSLGAVLRAQAEQCRSERFLQAEKKAMEAPVKMLLPMVSCIFPCTFLVLLYPIVHQVLQAPW
ncbi:MAG TPA: type II secretion system F family protein [Candidatus Paenalcaligenes intestinipullorum]|uniref:Type II secretion system F family protein n=1 Tax=Candidatus Paenalcaligenes intestinipullorum TaxID=2838718 RepID=A0A9D2U9U4_9BURK|nr:type II secretion system F family protein [Candidatus Paenalcaligenes intestinipullorum]